MAEFKIGRLKFVWQGAWAPTTAYVKDDVIRYGGRMYVCIGGHTSAATTLGFYSTDSSYWSLMADGQAWQGDWTTTTAYRVNDIVKYGGIVYICNTNHTSGATLETDQSKWTTYTNGVNWTGTYTNGTVYKVNDLAKYGADVYICTTAHTAASSVMDEAKFAMFVSGLQFENSWSSITSYQIGDIVTYGGFVYVAIATNSNQTPSTATSYWQLLTTGFNNRGTYSGATAYKTGDVVQYGGNTYECIVDSTGNNPTNATYWKLLTSGINWRNAWSNATDYALGDAVRYSSGSYICILGHTSNNTSNRPDLDLLGTYWSALAQGDSNYVLTTQGDLLTRSSGANVRLPIGSNGQILRSNGTDAVWATWGVNPGVYYVAKNGTDASGYGTTPDKPYLTVRYALQNVTGPATIYVRSGTYSETLPMSIPADVSIVGDELRQTIIQPSPGYTTSNMFYMRNGTGLRNVTLRGLSGTLGAAGASGTSRPSAGAYISLDPGTGPTDTSVHITTKSPYVQNVTTFGTGCTGMKIDGSLHNAGNKSILANDFTNVLSDGIGVWSLNLARAEIVSVFTYYCHVGYLSELGGTIRALNGNNSYGTYGSSAEGVDPTETPVACTVNNLSNQAQIAAVLTGSGQVLSLEMSYAGQNYTSAAVSFSGNGAGAACTPNFTNNAVNRVNVTSGGSGYFFTINNAQAGGSTSITLALTDTEVTSGYNGMRITIIDGTGAGQTGVISAYNGGTKVATIVNDAGGSGWDSLTGASIVSLLDTTTRYRIEPRVQISGGGSPTRTAKFRAVVSSGAITEIRILDAGAGYSSNPSFIITDPHSTSAASVNATRANGVIAYFTFSSRGYSYTSAAATISGNGYADIAQTGGYMNVNNLPSIPRAGSNLVIAGLTGYYRLVAITNLTGSVGNYSATFQVSPYILASSPPAHGAAVSIYARYSNVRLTGHDFLNIGYGNITSTNYPGTPAGSLIQINECKEYAGGRVFYTSTDQDGNFRVGSLFRVEQATGIATLNADAFNLSGLVSLSLGGTGVIINAFSADATFTANSDNIVPTQKAIRTFVQNAVGGGGSALVATSLTLGNMSLTSNTITALNGNDLVLTAGGTQANEISFLDRPKTSLAPTTATHLTNKTYVDGLARPTVHAVTWDVNTGSMNYVTETGTSVTNVSVNQQKFDTFYVSTATSNVTINSSGHMLVNL